MLLTVHSAPQSHNAALKKRSVVAAKRSDRKELFIERAAKLQKISDICKYLHVFL